MTDEIVKRIPTGLLGVALLVISAIVIVQRFVFGLPLYDGSGAILPAPTVATAEDVQGLEGQRIVLECQVGEVEASRERYDLNLSRYDQGAERLRSWSDDDVDFDVAP
jgi:hypothetical protein